jgi:hypothetical protein
LKQQVIGPLSACSIRVRTGFFNRFNDALQIEGEAEVASAVAALQS